MSPGKRPRVLLVNVSLENGGLERQLVLLADHLRAGWDVRLWTMEEGAFAQRVREAGIPWRSRPRRFRVDPAPAVDLWRVIGGWRPDVVHAWHWIPSLSAGPACRLLGIPLIDGSIRMGSVPPDLGRPRRSIMRMATFVVANSLAGLRAWGMEGPKGRVIYNAFDTTRIDAMGPPSRDDDGGPVDVVMVARMHAQKDYLLLIEAAKRLERDTEWAWRFGLVGDGPDRALLSAAAAGLMARGVCEMEDAGTEAIRRVASAQIGVLLTDPAVLAEGCSNSIMEYMACGLPVVCSDAGGSPELVRDGTDGYLVPPGDVGALTRRLSELARDPQMRRRMGDSGRRRIHEEFTIRRMVDRYDELYEEAICRRRGSAVTSS